ncbi:helix-hairpin-helix domain-containing protein [Patescibacteria group bacterium]|nr:helix-hairpin-helix domain-containing protein [Patescibacteria group bacterium]
MSNQQISRLLRNVAVAYSIKDESKFRFQIIAYNNASEAVAGSTEEIGDLIKQGKAISLPGIGPSIAGHLEDLCKNGKSTHFDWVFRGIPESVFTLIEIPGFGPKKAYKLIKEFGINDPKTAVKDLEKIAKLGKIAPLEGFGEKSQADILRAINEYRVGKIKEKRMNLPYASELATKMVNYLQMSKYALRVEPLGSLRRKLSTIGDIDIAVATDEPKKLLDYFTKYPYKERVIEKGDISSSIIISGGHQIDVMTQPEKSFGGLLQHFTGSKNHNIHLRELALKKGLSLSEKGIKDLKTGKINEFKDEESFYKAIGLSLIPPEIRENTGEIELAARNKLPKLIEISDIKGDLHIHSSYPIEPSHDLGKNTIEEMISKAASLNYDYLGFSEHNPSISKHSSKEIEKIMIMRDERLEEARSNNKSVRIIKLLEIDILPDGSIPIDDRPLKLLDGAIVSLHSSLNQQKKDITDRILKGLSHPKAKILGHPTGRIINEREGIEADWDKIFDFCGKNKKAIEINSWPTRLDLYDVLIRKALDFKVKFVINTDSHASYQMEMMRYGVSMAKRGWAKKSDILNTLPYNDIMDWLKS